jgi:hypothetical protein
MWIRGLQTSKSMHVKVLRPFPGRLHLLGMCHDWDLCPSARNDRVIEGNLGNHSKGRNYGYSHYHR